jgi:sugar/nucleoside kinase (ribokinase family)
LEKAPLTSIKAGIGGTSANVALAIQTFGGSSKLLSLTGEGDDFETHTLEYVLRNCKIPYKNFPILTTSHIALLPDDGIQTKKVFGLKGKILQDKLEGTFLEIEKEVGQYRIATGVRVEEVELVKYLFNKHAGFRSLNPRMELIKNKPIFYDLLKSTDLLILNMVEYQTCKVTSPSSLHEHGPSLVIVTDSDNGGMFSHKDTGAKTFPACLDYVSSNAKLFSTGAGDWFHGAFISRCMKFGKSFERLALSEILDFISFAAKVAGKKITMEGASNGPGEFDL